jgi:hypothetical protein
MTSALEDRHDDGIAGVLSCYDRVVITGTLPTVCYAEGMTRFLYANGTQIFEYPEFAMTLRECVREQVASVVAEAGVTIEHIAKSHIRKEEVVAKVLEQRGDHPGLVHVLSAMEACSSYRPWHDKQSHKTFLRPDTGKCLHYYFYFMDADLGLVYLRVPTWAPFRLQFYCNGHGWLARRLTAEGIGFSTADNAFVRIDDWQRAQDLADGLSPDLLHRVNPCLFASRPCCGAKWRDRYAALCCPVLDVFGQTYHWSPMQVEYATDLVFRSAATLKPLYDQLARESVLNVKAGQVATFLGRKIAPQLAQEIGSQFSTRIEGTCIEHRFGDASIKMYDKFGCVLRIETTTNDVSFFKHHRKVEHRQGPTTRDLAPVKKSIYSPIDLRAILFGCNRRYLEHLSALDDSSGGVRALDRVTRPRVIDDKTVKGINFFDPTDKALLQALQDPRVNIAGIRRGDPIPVLDQLSPNRLSRQLRRLRDIGVIKRVRGTYRYYLTRLGRAATAALCRVTESIIIPAMA